MYEFTSPIEMSIFISISKTFLKRNFGGFLPKLFLNCFLGTLDKKSEKDILKFETTHMSNLNRNWRLVAPVANHSGTCLRGNVNPRDILM